MYKKAKFEETSINTNDSYEGETIEQKVERILSNNDAITDGAPIVYQERNEGVQPAYDIRTDRFEIAVDAMDKVNSSKQASREERIKEFNEKNKKKEEKPAEHTEKITQGESTQAPSGSE